MGVLAFTLCFWAVLVIFGLQWSLGAFIVYAASIVAACGSLNLAKKAR